jgi:type II secretory pathway component PulJ
VIKEEENNFALLKGFTLIEVIVSVFLVSFGIVVLFGILFSMINYRDVIEKSADREATAIYVLNEFRREFESLYYCTKCGFILQEMGFFGKPFDSVIFTTYYGGTHKEIEYVFEQEKGKETARLLKRIDNKLDGDLKRGGFFVPILEGIKSFDVKAFGDKGWQERWDQQDGIPKFIEVNLSLEYGKNKERNFRIFVEPRHKDIIGGRGVLITPSK